MDAPVTALRPPRRSLARWASFVHLLARYYMDYWAAVVRASKRKRNRAADVDTQPSKSGTLWALHWPTVGQNHLHDPHGKIKKSRRIDSLQDDEIARLRSLTKKRPHRLLQILHLAFNKKVRVEVELKSFIPEQTLRNLMADPHVKEMDRRGDLQFKTLAKLPSPHIKLRAAHNVGGTTILTFTGYRGRGISKAAAWPVTDYVRGRAKWVA